MRQKKLLLMLTLLCTIVQGAWAEAGDTADNPITISSTKEWNTFVSNVNGGTNYSGKFVRLDADISVTEMAGSSETNSFQGTFLGNDKTLTFTKGSSESAFGEENCAPFRFTNNATFENLNVSGDIYTSRKFAAGLVAINYGTTTITNCRVSTVIHSSVSGDGTHGGIVAMPASGATTNITGCIYNGRLLTTNGTTYCGGFVGWSGNTKATVTNSLYAPNTALPASDGETAIDNGATFVRGNSNLTINANCYYTEAMGSTQGTRIYTNIPDTEIAKKQLLADNNYYYIPYVTISGVESAYDKRTGVSITPVVTNTDGQPLNFNSDYTLKLNTSDVSAFPVTTSEKGIHSLTFTGDGSNYYGSKTVNFVVNGALEGSGDSESDPVKIVVDDDWNQLADNVSGGNDYSGKYVKLVNDIKISKSVGTTSGDTREKFFSGTFDGNGKTITVAISDNANAGAAPFRYIKDATVKNLTVTGRLEYIYKSYAGGLVGFADGTNLIENCVVNTAIYHYDNCHYIGGIVGNSLNSATTVKGCVFAGRMEGYALYHAVVGGFFGWGDSEGHPILIDCLEKGSFDKINAYHAMGQIGNTCTIQNCYYINGIYDRGGVNPARNLWTPKGAYQVYENCKEGELNKAVTAADGNTYYVICTVSGLKDRYVYTGSEINVTPVITDGENTLVAGTDYTVSPANVTEQGQYMMTIEGLGNYTGTKTASFIVSDFLVPGKFRVNAEGKMVKFTQGNLQATTSDLGETWTWGIAKNPWDHVGNNTANTALGNPGTVTSNGTIDLFSWTGASSPFTGAAAFGIYFANAGTFDENIAYSGNEDSEALKKDWGECIGEGYRTLTSSEWDYVVNTRVSGTTVVETENARYAFANVNDVNGLILFPDGVTIGFSEASLWGPVNAACDWVTKCTAPQWAALAAKGCVFLPAAGERYTNSTTVGGGGAYGSYWSNTSAPKTDIGEGRAQSMIFEHTKLYIVYNDRINGNSVRLVKDYETPYDDAAHTLTDADSYTREDEDMRVASATYQKTLGEDRIGKHQPWFVPFDYTIKKADTEKFDFYKINMIANAPDAQTDATDDIWVFLKKVDAGTMLHANMPYVYKPKETVTDYAFTTENATLKAKATDARLTMMTAEDTYTLYGTYEPKTATAADPFYYVNINGKLSYGDAVTVGAFRWIMRVESKFGNKPAYVRQMVFFDGEEATGIEEIDNLPIHNSQFEAGAWYTLDGRKLDGKPTARGLYINNGKKIVIK